MDTANQHVIQRDPHFPTVIELASDRNQRLAVSAIRILSIEEAPPITGGCRVFLSQPFSPPLALTSATPYQTAVDLWLEATGATKLCLAERPDTNGNGQGTILTP